MGHAASAALHELGTTVASARHSSVDANRKSAGMPQRVVHPSSLEESAQLEWLLHRATAESSICEPLEGFLVVLAWAQVFLMVLALDGWL